MNTFKLFHHTKSWYTSDGGDRTWIFTMEGYKSKKKIIPIHTSNRITLHVTDKQYKMGLVSSLSCRYRHF